MKLYKFLAPLLIIFSFAVNAQSKTDTIKVYGECGMCKSRIQKTLKIDGITSADWNTETKLLVVSYDPALMTNADIQKKLSGVGHDTELFTADDAVYNKLPMCCHYKRKAEKQL